MVTADSAIRVSAVGAVAAVAGAAGWVSYEHALEVIRLAGESGSQAYVYPVFIDGMVYMSSAVMLMAARRKTAAPKLAWCSLATGIALTLAANVYSMASHGLLGCVAGALPAAALVLSYELLMHLIRQSAGTGARASSPPVPAASRKGTGTGTAAFRENGHSPDVKRFAGYLERGEVPGVRTIKRELSCGQPRAQEVRAELSAVLAASHN